MPSWAIPAVLSAAGVLLAIMLLACFWPSKRQSDIATRDDSIYTRAITIREPSTLPRALTPRAPASVAPPPVSSPLKSQDKEATPDRDASPSVTVVPGGTSRVRSLANTIEAHGWRGVEEIKKDH